MHYKVLLSEKALQDFNEIYDYIALDNPSIAESYTNELRQHIRHLADFPYIGKENPKNKRRRLVKKPYIINYSIDEKVSTIKILHIRHGARQPL
ncbi:MAG: type II toxin-antitoxin system RelE/ParE family toxin [Firmicutes bacterium]|nr:type II toxin-antitoxin system RelE/ParE family toxin [Bacillota bacterium]